MTVGSQPDKGEPMETTITLTCGKAGWFATWAGPGAKEVIRLSGTATIPTAFTAQADMLTVWRAVAEANPGIAVVMAG